MKFGTIFTNSFSARNSTSAGSMLMEIARAVLLGNISLNSLSHLLVFAFPLCCYYNFARIAGEGQGENLCPFDVWKERHNIKCPLLTLFSVMPIDATQTWPLACSSVENLGGYSYVFLYTRLALCCYTLLATLNV